MSTATVRLPDLQALAERAAILEFDQDMARADAEAQAVREFVEQHAGNRLDGILGELTSATRRRYEPGMECLLEATGLAGRRSPLWGFGLVVPEAHTYRPAESCEQGTAPALIAPISSYRGGLIDLCAQGLASGRMLTRLGVGDVVGGDEIDRARECGSPLLIFSSLATWIRASIRGAVIVDWLQAAYRLDGIREVWCSPARAPRIYTVTQDLLRPPRIRVPAVKENIRAAS